LMVQQLLQRHSSGRQPGVRFCASWPTAPGKFRCFRGVDR